MYRKIVLVKTLCGLQYKERDVYSGSIYVTYTMYHLLLLAFFCTTNVLPMKRG